MKINWNSNPLHTTIDIDEQDIEKILLYTQCEDFSNILCELELRLEGRLGQETPLTVEEIKKTIKPWSSIRNRDIHHDDVQYLVQALQGEHFGDCTCDACSRIKCQAEDTLGIRTTEGLGKHSARKIRGAFGLKSENTIDQALEILAKKPDYVKPATWPDVVGYEIHIPRWEEERIAAYEWLKNYKERHGF